MAASKEQFNKDGFLILKNFFSKEEIKKLLLENISYTNILAEVNYFFQPQNSSFERTYGWAWFMKMQQELDTCCDFAVLFPTTISWQGSNKEIND